jgi:hypothetical protein
MHVIVSTRGNRRWLSGIFQHEAEAEECLAALRGDASTQHARESVAPTQFPFFVLEDEAGFRFLDPTEAARIVQTMAAPAPNREPILFAVLAEYRSDVVGRDEMGRMRHVHLDQERLTELREGGLSSLLL